jgi:multidrug efflux pump subunit AcrB
MVISDFAIRRPIITIEVMVALVVFGGFSLLTLKTDEFPEVAPPFVTIAAIYPGGSPETVEKELMDPIEEAFAAISGVKKVTGRAEDGIAFITVQFVFEKPLAEATRTFATPSPASGRTCRPRWKSRSSGSSARPTSRSCRWRSRRRSCRRAS